MQRQEERTLWEWFVALHEPNSASYYDIVEGNSKHDLEIKQFKTTEDLTKLRRIAEGRDKRKELSENDL